MRWYRIVARHFSVLLTLFFITALLAGLLSESNYCYYLIGRVDTVDTQIHRMTEIQLNCRVMLWADSAGPAGAGPISSS